MLKASPASRRTVFAAVAVGSALLLSACGNDHGAMTNSRPNASSSYGPAASGPHNSADVTFASDMIPHHAQAVEMADLALAAAVNAEVRALATAIKGAQDPEILAMSGWLAGWGETVPVGSEHGGGGHAPTMPGMMSDSAMQELAKAKGSAFDRLWVQLMTEHHEGAVQMARTELTAGQNPQVKALATVIITAQTAEIATMAALAKRLPA